jgi:N-acetylmuramic acid 6-phosphate etherase
MSKTAGDGKNPPRTPLPADRADTLTEHRHPRTSRLHELGVRECVSLMGEMDREVLAAMDDSRDALASLIEAIEPGFLSGGRVVYLGAGTSGRLGVLDASEMPPTFQIDPSRFVGIIAGGDSSLRTSSEGREDDPRGAIPELESLRLTARDAVIGIAAGGTTPYVIGALAWTGTRPGPVRPCTALLSCAPVPGRLPGVDHAVVIATGPELVTGSTRLKAGTATKLALNTISTTLMVRAGRVYENLMVDMRASNDKLRDRAARIIATLTGLSREASFELLTRAGGSVKAAVVMQQQGRPLADADRLLAACHGRLDRALRSRPG